MDTFAKFLQQKHLRRTPERFALLEMVLAMPGHFAIDALLSRMNSESMTVSRGTVYNTVALLLDCGLVRCHRFDGSKPQYEVVTAQRANHLHLVCSRCGKVREVSDPEIGSILNSRRYETFHPEYYELSLYGICSRCQRKVRGKR